MGAIGRAVKAVKDEWERLSFLSVTVAGILSMIDVIPVNLRITAFYMFALGLAVKGLVDIARKG